MKFSPKAIFFDWDHTLWDHDRNAAEVIQELLHELNIQQAKSHPTEVVWETFQKINNALWDDYQHGRITQLDLRTTRFERFFDALSLHGDIPLFSKLYMERTPRKTNLLPGAYEVIETLSATYPLYVLTNGFDDIQHVKISGVGMSHFFERIITSDVAGCKKPAADFFNFALRTAGCLPEEVVMVGDHPIIDIEAAEAVGISAIHLQVSHGESPARIRIGDLRELLDLFE
ncbi:YjjG family noncanonical pyrimidine nucleotidase [Aquirufa sp.]|jgi:putative hydrolase of the HAD superfamily|uniref:YjjG family noncanonical pyrimidine nucleotidase n=1 Tax=Aquirufa sp. TaxID=2676249 RepID=UPI0037BEC869